jgi:hypothetical protein
MATTLVQGRISAAPDATDRVMVTVDSFDSEQQLGPCIYTPRPPVPPATALVRPAVDDACLLAMVDDGDSWVVAFDA